MHSVSGGAADLAFGVLAADAVGFFLGLPLVTPVGAVATLGAAVFGLLCFAPPPPRSCGIRVTARASQLGSMRKHEETWGKSAEVGRRETGAILAVFAPVCFCKLLKLKDLAMAPQVGLEPTTLRLTAERLYFT